MNTIKIQIPQGFAFDRFDEATGEFKLKPTPKPVMERIKTIDDVLADNGLTKPTFDKQCEALSDDEKNYRLLKLISKSLNEDWTPDWNDENQWKYYPWFYMGGSSGFRFGDYGSQRSASFVGSRLCFKTSKLAEYAGKQFEDVYKQFMLIA